ncbi:protein phosphatase 1 regulatory subunit 3C-like [Tachysurus vachellii]|uniref:protein phosphatase 1 regulatory subunit 3C-like n=1 Tax=Tachysurus vachellii TaxID=175792 RepID=UPI00296AE687|nr:protein phosphatase 1 regulatory subunit 3C-like [Tachysurus vachellii]
MCAAKVMPIDLSMHMGLSRHTSVESLLGLSTLRSHRTVSRPSIYDSLRPKSPRSPQSPDFPVSALNTQSTCGTLRKKKRVVFADDKGLPLTAVRIIESDPPVSDVEEISPSVQIKVESSLQNKKPQRLRLGFPQPSSDSPSFLESLKKSLVRLESCTLIYGSLVGKVRVCNISPEKAVHVRISHDSWRSHQDIPCTRIQEKNGILETELFVFNVPVPFCPNLEDRLEFYVTFRPGSGSMLWLDRNGGQNYRILVEDVDSEEGLEKTVEKKPLRPLNFQSPLSVPLRNGPAPYKSTSFSSIVFPKNITKTFSTQENIMPRSYSLHDSNSADK